MKIVINSQTKEHKNSKDCMAIEYPLNDPNINIGDAVLVEKNEKIYWEGNMEIIMSCCTAWNPEQHKIVM